MAESAAPTQVRSRFLNLRGLAPLENMRFTTRQRIEGAYSGRHRSRQHGGAGEFVDYREYSNGDDLRRLDWKVFSRTGRAYLRLYQEETNLRAMFALDVSGSMRFGARSASDLSGSKLEYLQYLATSLSYLIARGQDQVGLALLGAGLSNYVPPGGSTSHLATVHETIERISTQPTLALAGGLRDLFQRIARRGVLLLASDFLTDDLESAFAAVRLFKHRRWDVAVLHLVHPDEEELPQHGACRFEGLEGEGLLDCSPDEIREQYRQRFEQFAAMVRSLTLAAGCEYHRVSTAIPYLQTLRTFLVERSG